MAELSARTLRYAVQAVAAQIGRMEAAYDALPEDEDPNDLQDAIIAYSTAAAELKTHYLEAARTVINLPPYEELVPE